LSGAEKPERMEPQRRPTEEDIRELTGAATPQFALQLRDRVKRLIEELTADDPVRLAGERQIAELERLAQSGENRGQLQQHEQSLPSLTLDPNLSTRRPG